MPIDHLLKRTALSAAALAATATAAPAQYASSAFLDWTVEESRMFGIEMIAARLALADVFSPPFDEELVEQMEATAGPLLARFGGTLARQDAQLAEDLSAALDELAEAAEDQEDLVSAAAGVRPLLDRARELVIAADIRSAPAFKGAVLVDLLLAEGGVAEGYEEAVENVWEYSGGWAALQRVDALWAEIRPLASAESRADAEQMLASLHELYPDPGPPASVVGWNPEEAEAPSQRLAGIVEAVVEADLFPGRDFAGLAAHLADTVSASCDAYANGDDAVGAEAIIAVFDLYEGELAQTANLFAPKAHEEASDLFPALAELESEEDEEDEAEAADPDTEALSPATVCGNLSETLDRIGSELGG